MEDEKEILTRLKKLKDQVEILEEAYYCRWVYSKVLYQKV